MIDITLGQLVGSFAREPFWQFVDLLISIFFSFPSISFEYLLKNRCSMKNWPKYVSITLIIWSNRIFCHSSDWSMSNKLHHYWCFKTMRSMPHSSKSSTDARCGSVVCCTEEKFLLKNDNLLFSDAFQLICTIVRQGGMVQTDAIDFFRHCFNCFFRAKIGLMKNILSWVPCTQAFSLMWYSRSDTQCDTIDGSSTQIKFKSLALNMVYKCTLLNIGSLFQRRCEPWENMVEINRHLSGGSQQNHSQNITWSQRHRFDHEHHVRWLS